MAVPQKMTISLSGTVYGIRLTYCPPASCWIMDISDAEGNPLVSGVPLVTGAALLNQYAYLGFPGDIFAMSHPNPDAVPDFDGLGNTGELHYWPRFT